MSEAGTPGGPIKAAQAWIEAVQLGRYDMAWAMTDPRLRLARAQAWIWNNRKDADIAAYKRDELAEILAAERPTILWRATSRPPSSIRCEMSTARSNRARWGRPA